MRRFLNALLILLIIANVLMAFAIIMAPHSTLRLIESLLDNPQNLNSRANINESSLLETKQILLLGPAQGTIETQK